MVNRGERTTVFGVLLLTILIIGSGMAVSGTQLLQTDYYLIAIGTIDTPIESLIQTAQGKGFSVAGSYVGVPLTEDPEEALQTVPSLLYVDENWFLLRVTGEDFDYTVRPTGEGYELVLVPHKDLPQAETIYSVISSLQGMGIVGSVDMELPESYAKESEKGPLPPPGVAIDSSLDGLSVAADWFAEASRLGIDRVGLRVAVVAEKLPGGTIPEAFIPFIESESGDLIKLLLPIWQLTELARSSSIGYVRPPYRPQPSIP
jgi:hypothetical protein